MERHGWMSDEERKRPKQQAAALSQALHEFEKDQVLGDIEWPPRVIEERSCRYLAGAVRPDD